MSFSSHSHYYHNHGNNGNNGNHGNHGNIGNHGNNVCNNCGKLGHMFHQCKMPITSYGIILFRYLQHEGGGTSLQFLMIRRKDSFGYIDIIRGKYSLLNMEQIQNSFDEMSLEEKQRVLDEDFESLWKKMWGIETTQAAYRNEQTNSSKKFDILKQGIRVPGSLQDERYTLHDFIRNSQTQWEETEWEFPKGRKNGQEKDLDCALREFEEETGISRHAISVIENVMPFEENFMGSNHKIYKHKYFLAMWQSPSSVPPPPGLGFAASPPHPPSSLESYQRTEVSKMEWKTLEDCLGCIRPYHLEKKRMIENIYRVLQEYTMYY